MLDCGDLKDEEWVVIEGLLPTECGRKSRPAHDNRRFLNGMLHVLRIGCPWRDMHERCGKWNSVYVRFRGWAEQGVWDAILATLVESGASPSPATSAATETVTVSSACSATSSTNGASPPATTKPRSRSPGSLISWRSAGGCLTLSTGPRCHAANATPAIPARGIPVRLAYSL